jgi:two-component system, NarL family, sensor histidine kinase DevS
MESQDLQRLLPRPAADKLTDELQIRMNAALSARDRIYSLLEAVVSVGSNLNLEVLLRRIVETAVELMDARYGAMGVIGDGDRLAEFIQVGMTDRQIEEISHWPEGKGLLGLLITEPVLLRLTDISEHPASSGFPKGHPPMRSFLGAPIRIREEVYGNLYLTEKNGSGQFSAEDESVLVALAAAAGVAIENARLYEEARRQQRWLSATTEVTRRLLSGTEVEDALTLITELALQMTGSDLVVVALPTGDGSTLTIEHAVGAGADEARGLVMPARDSAAGLVLNSGEPLTITDFSTDERVSRIAQKHMRLGPTVLVPLGTVGQVRGVLTAGRQPGSMPLSPAASDMLVTFAAQAAIALELAEHRLAAERMAVFEDRDRIARDLHDLVIQRLYATGMSLQGVGSQITVPEVADRVSSSVDALDDTIKEIRSAIFALQAHPDARPSSLRARILFVAQEMAPALGFAAGLQLDGKLDTLVSEDIAENLLTALRETLSNAARHASASQVEVIIRADHELTLTVRDDGAGISPGVQRSGLRNLEQRAAALGGSMHAGPAEGGGTRLTWRVPLRQPA